VKVRVSIDGKFMGIVEVDKGKVGDAEGIFQEIKRQRPKEVKKVESISEKGGLKEFKKVIAPKDKPVVNFIS
jgi:hypothetical protein